MNEQDIKWLKQVFPLHKDKTLKGEVLKAYYEAERILLGRDAIQERGCSCNYNQLKSFVNELYNTWQKENT